MTESAADRNDTDLEEVGADSAADDSPTEGGQPASTAGADSADGTGAADAHTTDAHSAGGGANEASDPADGVSAESGAAAVAEELREEFDALNDRHLRLVAEFNNYRRRNEQERLTAWSRAQADMVEGFLDVLDDLHRVAELDLSNATVEAIMEGIDLVEKKFIRALSDASVEMVDPTGQPFDPEVMEAMMRVPSEDEAQIDTVAQCFQKGYSLKGILVRPARVSVYTQG